MRRLHGRGIISSRFGPLLHRFLHRLFEVTFWQAAWSIELLLHAAVLSPTISVLGRDKQAPAFLRTTQHSIPDAVVDWKFYGLADAVWDVAGLPSGEEGMAGPGRDFEGLLTKYTATTIRAHRESEELIQQRAMKKCRNISGSG